MADFDEIYSNINNSNIALGAGIIFGKLDSATVAGVSATQTLTNKTLTSPTINAGALSGTFSGSPTFSGNLTFSGTLTFSGAITFSNTVSFSENVNIATTKGLYFGAGNDTGLLESTVNQLRAVAGGVPIADFVSGGLLMAPSQDLRIDSLRRIYLDGSLAGDTYISEGATNQIYLLAGGVNCTFTATGVLLGATQDLRIDSGKKIRLDGSLAGDTSIRESSANTIMFEAGGTSGISMTQGAGVMNLNFLTSGSINVPNSFNWVTNSVTTVTFTDAVVDFDVPIRVGGSQEWELRGYTGSAPAATGYVTVIINGTTYKLLASNV